MSNKRPFILDTGEGFIYGIPDVPYDAQVLFDGVPGNSDGPYCNFLWFSPVLATSVCIQRKRTVFGDPVCGNGITDPATCPIALEGFCGLVAPKLNDSHCPAFRYTKSVEVEETPVDVSGYPIIKGTPSPINPLPFKVKLPHELDKHPYLHHLFPCFLTQYDVAKLLDAGLKAAGIECYNNSDEFTGYRNAYIRWPDGYVERIQRRVAIPRHMLQGANYAELEQRYRELEADALSLFQDADIQVVDADAYRQQEDAKAVIRKPRRR